MKLRGAIRPVIRPGNRWRGARRAAPRLKDRRDPDGLVPASERPAQGGMTLTTTPAAIAIGRGEHACCRFDCREDHESLATGEHARRRGAEMRDELTAQQLQIAELARGGLSNAEIGGRLFLSPRTVEWHLHHVFT